MEASLLQVGAQHVYPHDRHSQHSRTRRDRHSSPHVVTVSEFTSQVPVESGWWWIPAHDGGYQPRMNAPLNSQLLFAEKSEPFPYGDAGTRIAIHVGQEQMSRLDATTSYY